MNEAALDVLLDQNVPRAVGDWLRALRPAWRVSHATEVGLHGRPDDEVFGWAQQHNAVVITFDEDFADLRMYPLGKHKGVVRPVGSLCPRTSPGAALCWAAGAACDGRNEKRQLRRNRFGL